MWPCNSFKDRGRLYYIKASQTFWASCLHHQKGTVCVCVIISLPPPYKPLPDEDDAQQPQSVSLKRSETTTRLFRSHISGTCSQELATCVFWWCLFKWQEGKWCFLKRSAPHRPPPYPAHHQLKAISVLTSSSSKPVPSTLSPHHVE